MKFWNGYQSKTLEERGWAKIRVSLAHLATFGDGEFLAWLEEDRPGRWFEQGTPDLMSRDYYFEDHSVATLFALRWV